MNLLRDARALEADDNNSEAAEYASQSVVISDSVRGEAEELRETTSGDLFLRRVLAFTLAPVVGFITSLVFYLAYRAWRRPSKEEVLRMGIRRKEKRG